MSTPRALLRTAVIVLTIFAVSTFAQKREKLRIEASAQGTGNQRGHVFNLNIFIEQLSTPEDQKILIDAFTKSGNRGLVDALAKMKPKGRIAPLVSVGNDVKYIREFPSDKGRRFRLVTDRIISFGEAQRMSRSSDYSLSAVEITITADGKGSFGTLLPACKLKLNKQRELEIETLQNPWQLNNVVVYREK